MDCPWISPNDESKSHLTNSKKETNVLGSLKKGAVLWLWHFTLRN